MPRIRNRHLLLADALLLATSATLAFAVRFETLRLGPELMTVLALYCGLVLPLRLFTFMRLGLYARLWRYAGHADLNSLLAAGAASAALGCVVGLVAIPLVPGLVLGRIPYSVLALDGMLSSLALALPRLALRQQVLLGTRTRDGARRALVVGAGSAGAFMVREMRQHRELQLRPVAFVDDDVYKRNRTLQGVPIVGTLDEIPDIVRRYAVDEIVIAMPSAPGAALRRVLQAAEEVGVPTRTVPGLYELISGSKAVSALRKVEIDDLLRRTPIRTDLERVRGLAAAKTVLITGAGGSIGAELCRQLARLGPDRLVVVGRGENSIFELLHELARSFPELPVQPVIADVRDRGRLEHVFQEYRPATVFHAAAHKHVPLMEQNVAEAVLNNVLGTQVIADLASRYGAERFVLISSDKAVRPSSVMGATKRLAEGVVQEIGRRSSCRRAWPILRRSRLSSATVCETISCWVCPAKATLPPHLNPRRFRGIWPVWRTDWKRPWDDGGCVCPAARCSGSQPRECLCVSRRCSCLTIFPVPSTWRLKRASGRMSSESPVPPALSCPIAGPRCAGRTRSSC